MALALVEQGVEVLAVDQDLSLVERWADELTRVVAADSTDDQVLRQLGISNFDSAVVAIGDDIEASVLTVLALAESGVSDIWAKAISRNHGKPLAETEPNGRYGVTVVGITRTGEEFAPARPETVVRHHDHLVVSGPKLEVEKFCRLQ